MEKMILDRASARRSLAIAAESVVWRILSESPSLATTWGGKGAQGARGGTRSLTPTHHHGDFLARD